MDIITAVFENGILTLSAHDRVDTNNAAAAEAQIKSCLSQYPTDLVVIDCEDLAYISSAGLRVVLRLRKEKPQLRIINANAEVYDVFDMTGFTEMIPVEKAFRRMSINGCEVIGRGAKGTVYRYDPETVVKLYHDPDCLPDIQRERELARKAFVLGIPTAISYDVVKVDGQYASVFELLEAKCFSELIADNPENLDEYVREFALLLRQIHQTAVNADDMPSADTMMDKWVRFTENYLEEADYKKLMNLTQALPRRMFMLHGDYHTNNLMMQNGEALLIDMDTLCYGHPIIELVNVYVTFVGFAEIDPKNVENFLHIPSETAAVIWQKFLPVYLDTQDPARLADVEKKIRLLGCARVLRHCVRRDPNSADSTKAKVYCVEQIHQLLKEIQTLDF